MALKLYPGATQAEQRRSFSREVRAAARLDHSNVIAVLDTGEIDGDVAGASNSRLAAGTPWMALEFASGGTLGASPPTSFGELKQALLSVLDALGHAHARGVIHRDLKPSNLLVCTAEDVRPGLKLSDFGVATLSMSDDDDPTLLAPSAGTPSFMAPEQLLGDLRTIGPWTDLYALGCVAWTLCVGRAPYQRKSAMSTARAHLGGDRPAFVCPYAVPPDFETWLDALLSRHPDARPQLAPDAAAALMDIHDGDEEDAEDDVTDSMVMHRVQADDPTQYGFTVDDAFVEAAFASPDVDVPGRIGPPAVLGTVTRETTTLPRALQGAGLGLLPVRTPPVWGRDGVLDAIWKELRLVHGSGEPRVVLVRGGRGVGKSHLLNAVSVRAMEVGAAMVVRVPRGVEPLAMMIATHLRVESLGDSPRSQALSSWGLDAEGVASVEALLDGTLDAEARLGVCVHVLARSALERPLVVLVDDAHRKLEGIALVRTMVEQGLPVLCLLGLNDDEMAGRSAESRELDHIEALELELGTLPDYSLGRLIDGLIGLEPSLSARVVTGAKGRPAFVMQLLRAWAERGWLVPGRDGYALPADVPVALPDDLGDAWRKRILHVVSRLDPAAGWDLQVAATLGVDVSEALWHTACDDPDGEGHGWSSKGLARRQALLDALIRAQLVVEHSNGFSFSHRMLREQICSDAADQGRWVPLNHACARSLQVHTVDAPDRLGTHLVLGGEPEQAVFPLLQAASRRMATAPRQALPWVMQAEQAANEAGLTPKDPRSGQLLVARAEAHLASGEREEALRWARWGQRAAMTHGPTQDNAEEELTWWRHLRASMQLEVEALLQLERRQEASEVLPRLAPVVRRLKDPVPWGDLLMAQAGLHALLPDEQEVAVGLVDQAVRRYQLGLRQDRVASAQRVAAGLEVELGRPQEALGRLNLVLKEGTGGDRNLHGELLLLRGELLAVAGAVVEAETELNRGLAVLRSVGRPNPRAEMVLGVVESLLGRTSEGARRVAQLADAGQRGSMAGWVALAAALTEARSRRWAGVQEHLARAESLGVADGPVVRWMLRRFKAEAEVAGFRALSGRADGLVRGK